jgi:hypothetical protein
MQPCWTLRAAVAGWVRTPASIVAIGSRKIHAALLCRLGSLKVDAQSYFNNKTVVVEQQVATIDLLLHNNYCCVLTTAVVAER